MKIIHTSDIFLGRKFPGYKLAGDKIRAGLKTTFSKIIDTALSEKADLVIIAGNLFDNLDVSRNLLDFIASEFGRLENVPVVIMPGINDAYIDGSFWKIWQKTLDYENVKIIANPEKPYEVLANLNCTVYGIFENNGGKLTQQHTEYHIGALCSKMDTAKATIESAGMKFDYIALGGGSSFFDFTSSGLNAAYSGSPENLDFEKTGDGNIAIAEIDQQKNVTVSPSPVGSFNWKIAQVEAKEILTNEDLAERLVVLAGAEPSQTALRVTLSGLTLFESDLTPKLVEEQLRNIFLCLDIIDNTKVLPDNISEVKVSEKTLLGQYIKVIATEKSSADGDQLQRLEKSAKAGLALLQGREIW